MIFDREDYNYFILCNLNIEILHICQNLNIIKIQSRPYDNKQSKKFEKYILGKYGYVVNDFNRVIVLQYRYEFSYTIEPDEYIVLPEKTIELKIVNLYNKIMKANVFPKQLKKLSLIAYNQILCDITNLPIQLEELTLSGIIKFDLNNLPENLKKLILCCFIKNINYTLEDFHNLPIGLEKIIINKIEYNSINDLFNNY